jgi:hypothetical protein
MDVAPFVRRGELQRILIILVPTAGISARHRFVDFLKAHFHTKLPWR